MHEDAVLHDRAEERIAGSREVHHVHLMPSRARQLSAEGEAVHLTESGYIDVRVHAMVASGTRPEDERDFDIRAPGKSERQRVRGNGVEHAHKLAHGG